VGPRLLILAAALLFSTGGAAIKGCGLSAIQVASFRSGVAALALFALLPDARRAFNGRAVLVALAYAATMLLYVLGNKLTTAAHTIFLQGTAPLYVLLLSPLLLRERIQRSDPIWMLLVGGGLALLVFGGQAAQESAPDPATGNLYAACAGVSWAFTILGLRWLGRDQHGGNPGLAAVVLGNLFACIGALPWALPVESIELSDALSIGYLGVFQIGLAYACLTRGLGRVPALEAALLLLLEPVLNPIFSFFAHGEVPDLPGIVGGLLILAATLGRSVFQGLRARSAR
jgi:DME family drug/metabolite transporter